MVRYHVAHGAGSLVKPGSAFYSHGFSHGDLDMVDMVAIPKRLEDGVCKTHQHDVLHRLFAQEVVHAVDLALA